MRSGSPGLLVASHANGYSCASLAERVLLVWEGKREPLHALEQFDYIMACGGAGCARARFEELLAQ